MPERRFNWKCIDCGKPDVVVYYTAKGGKIPTWCAECKILHKKDYANFYYHKTKSPDVQTYTMHHGQKCEIEDCPKDSTKREWCEDHYRMWTKTGDPLGYKTRAKNALILDSETGLKLCCGCGQRRSADMFHVSKNRQDGLVVYCMDCISTRYISNPEPAKQGANRYRARKRQAFVQDIDRDLIYDIYNGCCYICGFELDQENWHLDHIHPLIKGGQHSYANVAPACPSCNLSKNKATLIEYLGEELVRNA